jgi:hypothetical protein
VLTKQGGAMNKAEFAHGFKTAICEADKAGFIKAAGVPSEWVHETIEKEWDRRVAIHKENQRDT